MAKKENVRIDWSKAYLAKPKDNLKSHVFINAKKFIPSYEYDPCPPPMSWLIGWEYARIWERERNEFVADRVRKSKPKRIRNDYQTWLEKRTCNKFRMTRTEESENPAKIKKLIKHLHLELNTPHRYFLITIIFIGIALAYAMRIFLVATSIRMAYMDYDDYPDKISNNPICEPENDYFCDLEFFLGWLQNLHYFFPSLFYTGYASTHLIGGFLSDKYGGKEILMTGMIGASICTLITPLLIENESNVWLLAMTIVLGSFEGVVLPSMSSILAHWIPRNEQTFLCGLAFSGIYMGLIIGVLVTIIPQRILYWYTMIYILGFAGILWSIVFYSLCYSDPTSHPYLNPEEKQMIRSRKPPIKRGKNFMLPEPHKFYKDRSIQVMAVTQFGHDWLFFTTIYNLTSYLSIWSGTPVSVLYLRGCFMITVMLLVSLAVSFILNKKLKETVIRRLNGRRNITTMSLIGGGCTILIGYYFCFMFNLSIIFIVPLAIFLGLYVAGCRLTPLDLSVEYAGILMGISNGFGALAGILAPLLVAASTTKLVWWLLHWTTFLFTLSAAILFYNLGSSKLKSWR